MWLVFVKGEWLVRKLGSLSIKFPIPTASTTLKQEGKLSIEEGSYAGLEAVANYYEQHKSLIGNDKSLNKIVKLNKKDQLMEYIKKELKS